MGIKYLKYFQEQLSRNTSSHVYLRALCVHFHSQELLDYVIIVLERKLLPDGALSQTEKPTFINDYNVLNFKAN